MAEAKHKDLILETIDSLRKRKARPDLERICHMVERRHNITFEETEADLEKLVDCGIVIKVDYKGSTSYRNAAKWRKSHLGGAGFNSHDAIRRLHSVVGSLLADPLLPPTQAGGGSGTSSTPTTTDPTTAGRRADQGVPAADIERRLLEEEDTAHLTPAVIQTALNKEVEAGRLKLLPSGNYIVGDAKLPERGSGKLSPGGGAGAEGGGARHPSGGSGGSPTKKGRPAGVKRKIKQCTKSPKEPKPKRPCSTEDALHSGNEGGAGGTGTGDTTPETRDDDDGDDQTPGGGPGGADLSDAEKELRLALPSSSSSGSGGTGSGQSGAGRSSSGSSSVVQTPKVSMAVLTADGLTFLDSEYKCDYCLLTSECNRVGRPEDLLYCKDCQAKAHPSCMDYSEDLARRARNSPWQCIDCKTCYVCEDSGDPDAMLFCDACDKGYHMNCHNPQVLDKPTGKWVCSKCVLELGIGNGETLDQGEGNESELRQGNGPSSNNNNTSSVNKNTEGGGASCLPTPSDSPVYFNELQDTKDDRSTASSNDHKEHRPSLTLKISNRHMMPSLPRLSDTLPAVVPDASEWTIDDVVQFFRNVGFVDQAEVFREQEIDGRSLLLMRRSDVLTGLSLKLGPALKIYTHVQRLQMRCDSAL